MPKENRCRHDQVADIFRVVSSFYARTPIDPAKQNEFERLIAASKQRWIDPILLAREMTEMKQKPLNAPRIMDFARFAKLNPQRCKRILLELVMRGILKRENERYLLTKRGYKWYQMYCDLETFGLERR